MSLVTALWRRASGEWGCLCTKSKKEGFREHWFKRPFIDVDAFVRKNQDKDVYFCPHLLDAKKRKKEHAVLPKLLWADLDEANPNELNMKPTVALESSPGRYVGFWQLDDGEMTEDLNKRLTYYLGADHGGWDLTQVLRVPGTTNYKYTNRPQVRELWTNGPTWKVSELEKELPRMSELTNGHRHNGQKPRDNTTSGLFYREVCNRLDRGKTCAEIEREIELSPSRWSNTKALRFQQRGQLRVDIDRVYDKWRLNGGEPVNGSAIELDSVRASDVPMEPINWFWRERFAYGKLGMIVGDPDQGKSQLALDMVARATRGWDWPDGNKCKACNAIIMSAEDDLKDTLVPRLAAAGADLERIRIAKMMRKDDQRFMFSLADDLPKLERLIDQMSAGIVIIDPVTAYMGFRKIDSFRTTDVRSVLTPLKEMAERTRVACILITHFSKNTVASAINRITDSLAFGAAVRHCYACIPEESRKLFLKVKNNAVRSDEQQGLAYSFAEKRVAPRIRASRIIWDSDHIAMTANEALAALRKNGRPDDAREKAKDIIRMKLAGGREVAVDDINEEAERRMVSITTMHRAAEDLGVIKSGAKGPKGKSTWKLGA